MLVWYRLNAAGTAYAPVGSIEDMASLVWTERWQDYGEAQVRMPLTHDVRTGDLLALPGRDMVAEVAGRTETEKGLELRCRDALSILDRRVVYPKVSNNGQVRTWVQKLLQNDRIVTDGTTYNARTLRPLRIGTLTAITGSASLQRSYDHAGEALLDVARAYGFDPVCSLQDGLLYVGARVSSAERVWGLGLNLGGYTQDEDIAESKNVAYVAGQVYDNRRTTWAEGETTAANLNRRETSVDRRDLATQGTVEELEEAYGAMDYVDTAVLQILRNQSGDFQGEIDRIPFTCSLSFGGFSADIDIEDIRYANDELDTLLRTEYAPEYWLDDLTYYGDYVQDASGFHWHFEMDVPVRPDRPMVHKTLDIYDTDILPFITVYMVPAGVLGPPGMEALADLQPQKVFEARLEGLTPYSDYGLGDAVTIYGAGAARTGVVAEIVESWDERGYTVTPGLRMDTD